MKIDEKTYQKIPDIIYLIVAVGTLNFLNYLLLPAQQEKIETVSSSVNMVTFLYSVLFFCGLYLLLTLIFSLIRVHSSPKNIFESNETKSKHNGYLILFLLIWVVFLPLFYSFLSIFLENELKILGSRTAMNSLWQTEPLFSFIFLTTVTFSFLTGMVNQPTCTNNETRTINWYVFFAQISIVCLFAHALFFPNYMSEAMDAHHGNAYYNTIYNLFKRTPYNDFNNSLYGQYALFLAPILRVAGPSMTNFAYLMSGAGVIYMSCMAYSIHALIKRNSLRILATLSVGISVIGFRIDPYYQTQPHRVLFPGMMLAYAVFTFNKGKNRRIFQIGGFLLAALAIVWNKESGMVCAIAWGALQIYDRLRQNSKKSIRFWMGIVMSCTGIVMSLFLSVSLVGIYNFIVSGSWIEWDVFWFPLFTKEYMVDTLQDSLYRSLNLDVVVYLTFMYPVSKAIYGLFSNIRLKKDQVIQNTCTKPAEDPVQSEKECLNFQTKSSVRKTEDSTLHPADENITQDGLLLFNALLGLGLLTYYINRPAYFNIDVTHGFFFILIGVYTEKNISRIIINKHTYKINHTLRGILSYIGVFLMLSFSIMGILHFQDSNKTRAAYRKANELEELAAEIQNSIPAHTIAYGNGIAEIYTELGWNSGIYMFDASDITINPEAEMHLAEYLNQLDKPVLIGENPRAPLLERYSFVNFLENFRLEKKITSNEMEYLYFVPIDW